VEEIRNAGGTATPIQGDMSDEADVERVFATVDGTFGRLTHLVYSSGIVGKPSRVEDVEGSTLRQVLGLNVTGAFYAVRAAIPRMSKKRGGLGGAIVLISSAASVLGSPGEYVWYAASKGAIDTMTYGLAKELGGDGIRVNTVSCGVIDTTIHTPRSRLERIIPNVPLGRIGTPNEVAESILFLLSEASSYTTGAILRVSGGR
jgi:NAD(P)-dependent dehydrogenase (short-subunit alcohol dehydrogenase family)